MIKRVKKVSLKNPIFIGCWPGMGEVAIRTGLFLKDALEFEVFAEIRNSGFFMPQGVISNKGIVEFPIIDEGTFYVYKDPLKKRDIVLLLAEAQPSIDRAFGFAQMIVEYLLSLKIKMIFTFASLPQPIDYSKESKLWFVSTEDKLKDEFKEYSLSILEEGQISGLNGILTGVAGEYGMLSSCFLAEIPFYTVQIENPKATKSLLYFLSQYLNLQFNLDAFDLRAKELEQEIERLITYIKGDGEEDDFEEEPLSEQDIDRIRNELERFPKLPDSIARRIDALYVKAREEISHAQELKVLLDHWGVYKEYEDRFLDLFKTKGLDH